jgi:uncharacterized RDD family membrane protein YckC
MDTPTIESKPTDQPWIANFWRRFSAFFIDCLLIALVGYGISQLMVQFLVENPGLARLIGFLIVLPLSIIFDSSIGHGQTPGKKLLKLRVVDKNNLQISPLKAAARAIIIYCPLFLNGAAFPEDLINSKLGSAFINVILFGGLFALLYLIIFNRNTRQSLHDIVTGTYVINSEASIDRPSSIWKWHIIIVIIFALSMLALPWLVDKQLEQVKFDDLSRTQEQLSSLPNVVSSKIMKGENQVISGKDGKSTSTFISVSLNLREDTIDDEIFGKKVANHVLLNTDNACSKDVIFVSLSYGYSIVIAGRTSTRNYVIKTNELEPSCLEYVRDLPSTDWIY